MDYRYLMRRSLSLMRRHHALWVFGILASLVGGIGATNLRYSPGNSRITQLSDVLEAGRELLLKRPTVVVIGATVVLVVVALFVYISLVSRASLIISIHRLELLGEERVSLREGFRKGAAYFWQFLAIYVVFLVGYSGVGYGVVSLVLLSFGSAGMSWSIYLTVPIAGLALILLYAILVTMQYFALRAVSLENAGIWKSLVRAAMLLSTHLMDCVKLAATYLVVYVGAAGGLALAVGLPLYYYVIEPVQQRSGSGPALITTLVVAAFTYPLLLVVDGVLGAYIAGIYTIGYMQMTGTGKADRDPRGGEIVG